MKTWIKLVLVAVALIVIGIVAYKLYERYFVAPKATKESTELASAVKNNFEVKSQSTFKDSTGAKHNQYDAGKNVFSQRVIDSRKDSTMGGPDSAAQILKIQRDQIEYWKQIAITSQATVLKAKSGTDSLGRLVRYYKGKYMEIVYHPPASADSTDNGSFDYKGHFTLTGVQYYKNKFLWWKYNPVTDLSLDDPNATIAGYRTYSVEPAVNTFNIKGRVKALYNFATGKVIPSSGVEINAGRFDFDGMYYYSDRLKKLSPIVSVSYNFLQLHK